LQASLLLLGAEVCDFVLLPCNRVGRDNVPFLQILLDMILLVEKTSEASLDLVLYARQLRLVRRLDLLDCDQRLLQLLQPAPQLRYSRLELAALLSFFDQRTPREVLNGFVMRV